MSLRELSIAIDNAIIDYLENETINDHEQTEFIESYKKLNEKCDNVIKKIKIRKSKKIKSKK